MSGLTVWCFGLGLEGDEIRNHEHTRTALVRKNPAW
jgi:hypothetical protein